MERSNVARAMLPETSTALSAASRSKTSSRQPEKLGFVSKTVTRDICRTGLSWHSARLREGPVWSTCTLVGTPRSSGIGATFPLGRVLAKDRIPCRAAVRGPSRSSTALNPKPTAQTDPRTRSRGITRVAVGAFSAMVVGGEEVGRDDRGIRSRTLKVQQRSVRKRSRGNGGRAGSCK